VAGLPAGVPYGQVKWRALTGVADGGDPDALPDARPVAGEVVFAPSASMFLFPNDPEPITFFATAVKYTLNDVGILVDAQGRELLTLLSTDLVTPNVPSWYWNATFTLSTGEVRAAFPFLVPADTVTDLTRVAPISTAPGGMPITKGDPGLSAYDVAVKNGFVGTEGQWLATLAVSGGATMDQIQTAVGTYISNNVDTVLAPHVNDLTPHPVYDDMASLTLLFENGLA